MTEKNISPEKTGQKLIITDRKILDLTGVTDVVSFDETGAVLKTDMGTLGRLTARIFMSQSSTLQTAV